jgi:outer membrane protein OmpA-like peptidoglycan-associated protein
MKDAGIAIAICALWLVAACSPLPMAGGSEPVLGLVIEDPRYLVFFDWDHDDITWEGQQVIKGAAKAYKSVGSTRIQVTGFTDRTGARRYNQQLSERRAANVADGLESLGVARSDMTVAGRAENDRRIPTAPGVREPQNRRVEIIFP